MKYILLASIIFLISAFTINSKERTLWVGHVEVINLKKNRVGNIVWIIDASTRQKAVKIFDSGIKEKYLNNGYKVDEGSYMIYQITEDKIAIN